MKHLLDEHHSPRRPRWLKGAAVLVLACAALGGNLVLAADPPQPGFFWPYGRVSTDGLNSEPQVQTVVALVGGKACGEATTKVVEAAEGIPPADVGATLYLVDVLPGGTAAGQRPGCGDEGEPVMLYFVGSRRIAIQQPAFTVGGQRVDVDLGPELGYRLYGAMSAGDGAH